MELRLAFLCFAVCFRYDLVAEGQDIDECASAPCLNGVTCIDDVNMYVCTCAAGFHGVNCDSSAQIGVTACADTTDCASLANAVCDTIVTQRCVCVTSQGFTSNADNTGCDYDCGALTNPTNGVVTYTTTIQNSVATYNCEAGFKIDGVTTRTCSAVTPKGWSDTAPTCTSAQIGVTACTDTTDCASLANAVCDTIVTMVCVCVTSQGFTANGDNMGCDYDCGVLASPSNGFVTYKTTIQYSVATYNCEAGFKIDGVTTRTCSAVTPKGWNDTAPTCFAETQKCNGLSTIIALATLLGVLGVSLICTAAGFFLESIAPLLKCIGLQPEM